MSEVTRYSYMQIVDSFTKFRMAIKGNTVPYTEMWVRVQDTKMWVPAIDYDALRADFLNAVLGRDIAINERDAAEVERNALREVLEKAADTFADFSKYFFMLGKMSLADACEISQAACREALAASAQEKKPRV